MKELDAEFALELSYRELQDSLAKARRELKRSIEKNQQIENRLQRMKLDTILSTNLKSELEVQTEISAGLKENISSLNHKAQVAYTKKQVLIARDKAQQETEKGEYRFCLANPLEKEIGTLVLILRNAKLQRNAACLVLLVSLSIFVLACINQADSQRQEQSGQETHEQ